MGEKEPFENKKPTHGLCKECQPWFFRRAGFPEEEIEEACRQLAENEEKRKNKKS